VAKEQIELYKKIRNIVQLGDLYRLKSSLGGGYSAVQYVSKDMKEAVIFVFRTWIPRPGQSVTIFPRGLHNDWLYKLDNEKTKKSGLALSNIGLTFELGNFESRVVRLHRVVRVLRESLDATLGLHI